MSRVQKSVSQLALAVILTFLSFYLMMVVSFGTWLAPVALQVAGGVALLTALVGALSLAARAYSTQRVMRQKQKVGDGQNITQKRQLEVDLPHDTAYNMALEALYSLEGERVPHANLPSYQVIRLHEAQPTSGLIKAGLRSKTFGITDVWDISKIELQLERLNDTTTRIVITSRPAISSEIYDMGRNLHYVNHLALFIRREAQAWEAESRLQDTANDTPLRDESSDQAHKRRQT